MSRVTLLLGGIAVGVLAASAAADPLYALRTRMASLPGLSWVAPTPRVSPPASPPRDGDHAHHDADGILKLSDDQITAAGITIAEVKDGVLGRRLSVPGTVVPSGDKVARVAVKLLGTVAELRKRLGDAVEKSEVVAVIESREVADAKSEFLATRVTHELQQTLVSRALRLFEGKVMTENDYLRARATADDARVKHDIARQKLFALGLTEAQIASLPTQPPADFHLQELRTPIAGTVAERRVELGALVGREGLESELFVIADLSEVWVELAVSPADLPLIAQGQEITIGAGATGPRTAATIMFVSPLLDKDTRAARVVALLSNPQRLWKPGAFVTAEIQLTQQRVAIAIPKAALQNVKGERVVFVRTAEGFEARKVATGREDDRDIEILSGLAAGENIAVANSFVLKAELGKSEAAHDD
jgi:membrane fusion protein, heavy metal efflux system